MTRTGHYPETVLDDIVGSLGSPWLATATLVFGVSSFASVFLRSRAKAAACGLAVAAVSAGTLLSLLDVVRDHERARALYVGFSIVLGLLGFIAGLAGSMERSGPG